MSAFRWGSARCVRAYFSLPLTACFAAANKKPDCSQDTPCSSVTSWEHLFHPALFTWLFIYLCNLTRQHGLARVSQFRKQTQNWNAFVPKRSGVVRPGLHLSFLEEGRMGRIRGCCFEGQPLCSGEEDKHQLCSRTGLQWNWSCQPIAGGEWETT